MGNGDSVDKQPFVAQAMDPLGADADYLAKMIFSEDAAGGPDAWSAVGNVALNRLKTGRFGKSLKSVVGGMSSAIKTKSPQWQKASKGEFNDYEQRVFNKIHEVATGLVGGKIPDNVGGATHFENLTRYPLPYWAKGMSAVGRVGEHTYFKEKNNGDGQGRLQR